MLEYIKTHAQMNQGQEIYGWVVGSENEEKSSLTIEGVFSSHQYIRQNMIRAEPNPSELSALSAILPVGLGIIGIYHSHPGAVVQSSTDIQTLQEMTKYYSNLVSIITNGEIIKIYRLDSSKRPIEVKYEILQQAMSEFTKMTFNCKGRLSTSNINNISPIRVMDVIEQSIRTNLQKEKDHYYEEIRKAVNDLNYPIKMEIIEAIDNSNIGNENSFEYAFEFETILDIKRSFLERYKNQEEKIIEELLMNILTQIRSLRIDQDNNKLKFSRKKSLLFQDIPVKFYLSPINNKTPTQQFLKDMELREAIMGKIKTEPL